MFAQASTALRERWPLVREIYNRPWCRRFLIGWAALGSWDLFISQFLPETLQKSAPRVHQVLSMTSGWLGWDQWLMMGLAVAAISSIEYAVRQRRKVTAIHAKPPVIQEVRLPVAAQQEPSPDWKIRELFEHLFGGEVDAEGILPIGTLSQLKCEIRRP